MGTVNLLQRASRHGTMLTPDLERGRSTLRSLPTRSTALWVPRASSWNHPAVLALLRFKAARIYFVKGIPRYLGCPSTSPAAQQLAYQFREADPLMINSVKHHKQLPVYGDGMQIRDWLYVGDHCKAH